MIKRKILTDLTEHLASDQMTILVGPRQVGKTYLMTELKKKLAEEKKPTIWLNLDIETDRQKMATQAGLVDYLALNAQGPKTYVFIDEIQRKENTGLFLKGLYDMRLPYKFIISGSGSLEIKAKIPESMAGRKRLFEIEPINFEEFVNFKTGYRYENKLLAFFQTENTWSERLLSEYLTFGGYPRIILAQTAAEKQVQMQEIYSSFIEKDILELLRLEKTEAFRKIVTIMAAQIGSLVNASELASTVNIEINTLKRYLWYLEQTFIVKKVTPFYKNTRSEITKMPVYYFVDTGLRNWLLGLFGLPEIPSPLAGHLFENLVYNTLRIKNSTCPMQIHFWRTKGQAEVDFVLESGLKVIPLEAKFSRLDRPVFPRSFRQFIAKYKPELGFLVHTGKTEMEETVEETKLRLLPFFKLLFHPLWSVALQGETLRA